MQLFQNWFAEFSWKFSSMIFLIFLASLLIVIGAGVYQMARGRVENFASPFAGSIYKKLPNAFYAGLYPYAGWYIEYALKMFYCHFF